MADEKSAANEIKDSDLQQIAGGGSEPPATCPVCGASNWSQSSPPPMLMYRCGKCGEEVFVEV